MHVFMCTYIHIFIYVTFFFHLILQFRTFVQCDRNENVRLCSSLFVLIPWNYHSLGSCGGSSRFCLVIDEYSIKWPAIVCISANTLSLIMHLIDYRLRDKTCSIMKDSTSFNFTVPCHTDIDPFLEWFEFCVLSFGISTIFRLFTSPLRLLA